MNIILTTPITHDSLSQLQKLVTKNAGNHVCKIDAYKEFLTYGKDKNIMEDLKTHMQCESSFYKNKPTNNVIEDWDTYEDELNNNIAIERFLQNIHNYTKYIGAERIAEKIIMRCAEILENHIYFNIIQAYDKTTVDVLEKTFKNNGIVYRTMNIDSELYQNFQNIAKELKEFELANTEIDFQTSEEEIKNMGEERIKELQLLALTIGVKIDKTPITTVPIEDENGNIVETPLTTDTPDCILKLMEKEQKDKKIDYSGETVAEEQMAKNIIEEYDYLLNDLIREAA